MDLTKYNASKLDNIDSICFIMNGLLGDILIRTPVLEAFKYLYPKAEISVIVDPVGHEVFKNYKGIKHIIIVQRFRKNKVKNHFNKMRTIMELRKKKFTMVVNLYNGGFSPWLVFFSGAKYKLGFCNQKKYGFVYNIRNDCAKDRLKQEQSLYNYMISIVEPFGLENIKLQPTFFVRDEVLKKMEVYLASLNNKKVYLLNFGSGDAKKILEFEKYFELVQYIYKQYGYVPAIISNPSQEFLQEKFIKDFMKESNISYIKLNQFSLEEVAALIKLTQFIITPDTGLLHLAMSFNNYIYAIFTYTHPVFVDIGHKNFISVYEKFSYQQFYEKQNITFHTLKSKIDLLFERMQSNFIENTSP